MNASIFLAILNDFIKRYRQLETPIKDAIDPLILSMISKDEIIDETTFDACAITIWEALYGQNKNNN